jgi:hypothetical protein
LAKKYNPNDSNVLNLITSAKDTQQVQEITKKQIQTLFTKNKIEVANLDSFL